jgi:hypothetical protein
MHKPKAPVIQATLDYPSRDSHCKQLALGNQAMLPFRQSGKRALASPGPACSPSTCLISTTHMGG